MPRFLFGRALLNNFSFVFIFSQLKSLHRQKLKKFNSLTYFWFFIFSSDEQDVEDDTEDDTDSKWDIKEMFRILKVIYTGKLQLLSFV